MSAKNTQDCRAWEEQVYSYAEAGLGPAEAGALEDHLATCGACRALVDELRALQKALAGAPELDPPAEFATALRGRLADERPSWREARTPKPWWQIELVWQVPAVALGLVATIALAWLGGRIYADEPWMVTARSAVASSIETTRDTCSTAAVEAAAAARELPSQAPRWWDAGLARVHDVARFVVESVGVQVAGGVAVVFLVLNVLLALPKRQLRLSM